MKIRIPLEHSEIMIGRLVMMMLPIAKNGPRLALTDKGKNPMPNMSYCQFENTLGDLRACREAMHEPTDDMNEYEQIARHNLFRLVREMAQEIEDGDLLDSE